MYCSTGLAGVNWFPNQLSLSKLTIKTKTLLNRPISLLFQQESMDMDMMVDACLLLWKKCKEVFAKFQTGSTDNPKYLQKMENPSKVCSQILYKFDV